MVEGLKGGMIPQRPVEGRSPTDRSQVVSVDGAPRAGADRSGPGARAAADGIALKGLVRDLARTPPVDAARVADLRAAISAGRYPLDSAAVADAMIRSQRG